MPTEVTISCLDSASQDETSSSPTLSLIIYRQVTHYWISSKNYALPSPILEWVWKDTLMVVYIITAMSSGRVAYRLETAPISTTKDTIRISNYLELLMTVSPIAAKTEITWIMVNAHGHHNANKRDHLPMYFLRPRMWSLSWIRQDLTFHGIMCSNTKNWNTLQLNITNGSSPRTKTFTIRTWSQEFWETGWKRTLRQVSRSREIGVPNNMKCGGFLACRRKKKKRKGKRLHSILYNLIIYLTISIICSDLFICRELPYTNARYPLYSLAHPEQEKLVGRDL